MKQLLIVALMLASTFSHAEVNFFADASTVIAYSGDTQSEKYPTGNYPFIGRVGLEYQHPKYPIALQTGILHRSNVDLTGREYYFNGLFIGASFRHCLYACKGLVR